MTNVESNYSRCMCTNNTTSHITYSIGYKKLIELTIPGDAQHIAHEREMVISLRIT